MGDVDYKILNKIFSNERHRVSSSSKTHAGEVRNEFRRDYDRIIFSAPFRRLQNKTQVFPLPGSTFVHNRLTHSLECATVGRSLGVIVGRKIIDKYKMTHLDENAISFYNNEFCDVISAASLCHDIGNPAFGHSGENAISNYFSKNSEKYKTQVGEEQWKELINFEGNANGLRVLSLDNSLNLTYSTLSAILKYPHKCDGNTKYGFFQTEANVFEKITKATNMKQKEIKGDFFRHPFVLLVEAADDICYNIIDLEDAHRLNVVQHEECVNILKAILLYLSEELDKKILIRNQDDEDNNDYFSYLRSVTIHNLILTVAEKFMSNLGGIIKGEFKDSLLQYIERECDSYKKLKKLSQEKIYANKNVLLIENSGFNVMYELLDLFVPAVITTHEDLDFQQKKAIQLLPEKFRRNEKESNYIKIRKVIDYVSGMTDNYAVDLYRRIIGIEIGMKF